MRPLLALAGLALSAVPILAGCSGPDLSSEAEDLRTQISEIGGVTEVVLDYTEPVTLDSGKLALTVTMADDAEPAAVVEVVTTAYAAFADTHSGEEGDLDVARSDDVIHLRSFEPAAEVEAVREAATQAVSVLATTVVHAEINTQEVNEAPHVFTRFTASVTESTAQAVLNELSTLERTHGDLPNAAWRVQVGEGDSWLLGADHGFPDVAQVALFERLIADLPDGIVVGMFASDFVGVRVARGVAPGEVSAAVGRHLRLLDGVDGLMYDVDSRTGISSFSSDGECFFGSDRLGVRLERDHGDRCSEITRGD